MPRSPESLGRSSLVTSYFRYAAHRLLAAARCAVATVITQAAPTASPGSSASRRWPKAVLKHEPGSGDEALAAVAAWPASSVRVALWVDVRNLAAMMRNRATPFDIRQPRQRASQQIRYTANDMRRLRRARLRRGRNRAPPGPRRRQGRGHRRRSPASRRARRRARPSTGDASHVLRRGALLHTDVGDGGAVATHQPRSSRRDRRVRSGRGSADDGLGKDARSERAKSTGRCARMLLDQVQPARVRSGPRSWDATAWSCSGIARRRRGCSRVRATRRSISIARARFFQTIRTSPF